ncbi:unnamed protein product [Closterium sp. Yama58-4]|nr:unnamed protein product [Closterium sp. Yama58-4]
MAALQEVVVAAASVDSPVCVWDLTTGSLLASLVSSSSQRRGLCAMGRDHVAVSQLTRGESKAGAVNVWSWRKSAVAVRSPTTEAIGPLAATADGVYLCGGGVSGRVYVWEAATGRLLRVWAAHYRAVTCLALSDDDALLVSAGEDSIIHVTPLVRISPRACSSHGRTTPKPSAHLALCFSFSSSPSVSLQCSPAIPLSRQAITSLWMAAGGVNSVLVSSSSDHSCKIWSLAMGALLRSYVFPVAVTAAAMDPGEYTLYAGGADGNIYLTALNFTAVSSSAMDPMTHDDALIGHSSLHMLARPLPFCISPYSPPFPFPPNSHSITALDCSAPSPTAKVRLFSLPPSSLAPFLTPVLPAHPPSPPLTLLRPSPPLTLLRPSPPLTLLRPSPPLTLLRPSPPLTLLRPSPPLTLLRPSPPLTLLRPSPPLTLLRPSPPRPIPSPLLPPPSFPHPPSPPTPHPLPPPARPSLLPLGPP